MTGKETGVRTRVFLYGGVCASPAWRGAAVGGSGVGAFPEGARYDLLAVIGTTLFKKKLLHLFLTKNANGRPFLARQCNLLSLSDLCFGIVPCIKIWNDKH